MNKKVLIILILILSSFTPSFANSYFAKLVVKVPAESSGMGKVYAVPCDSVYTGEFSNDSVSASVTSQAANQSVSFYAYAQSADESVYSFLGWSDVEGGAIISTANPYQVNVMSPDVAGTTNTKYLYANFIEKLLNHITFFDSQNGQFVATDSVHTITGAGEMSTRETVYFTALPDDGYKIMGWYFIDENGEKNYFSTELEAYMTFTSDLKVGVDFVREDVSVFTIKGKNVLFTNLNDANDYATSEDVIVLTSDGTLKKGEYNIKKGVTLLIPFDKDYTCYTSKDLPNASITYIPPTVYRTLTLEEGAVINVEGSISVSSNIFALAGTTKAKSSGGHVNGDYAQIVTEKGSSIILNDGSNLYAWGYILGDGNVIANESSSVYEVFQLSEFRGGTALDAMSESDKKVFPLNQYFIQNIEAPLFIKSGAEEKVIAGFSVESKALVTEPFSFVGKNGMFVISEGAELVKYFDNVNDRQVYELNGDASFGGIEMKMNGIIVKSKNFVLPLTNNLSITINSGTLSVNNQNGVALLPDAKLTINKDAKMLISDSKFYVYDADDWDEFSGIHAKTYHDFTPIKSPTMSFVRTSLDDATLDIIGEVETQNGALYTTEFGANVCCSEGRGKVILNNCTLDNCTYQVFQDYVDIEYASIPINSVKLKNKNVEESEYVLTDSASPGTVFYFHQETGVWDNDEIPVGISVQKDTNDLIEIYNVNGLKQTSYLKGVNIIKRKDGSIVKIIR